tara:strand:+ start:415 stop:1002 length:588 start_codon:yes stop_codon:yes gene_type:complete
MNLNRKMGRKAENSCKNSLLYFSPSEGVNSYFHNSLIYICEHNEESSMGVIINRTTPISIEELFKSLDLELEVNLGQKKLLLGGPVNPDSVLVLHDSNDSFKSSINIINNINLTTSLDILKKISIGEGPENFLILLGYSGWSGQQLDYEISDNAWIQLPSNFDIIFKTPHDEQVEKMSDIVGFDLTMVSPDFGNA